MKDTIKSTRGGYSIKTFLHRLTGEKVSQVFDGDNLLFMAQNVSYSEYLDNKQGNEMFVLCEVFTTIKNNQFVYWRDNKTDVDYITKLEV